MKLTTVGIVAGLLAGVAIAAWDTHGYRNALGQISQNDRQEMGSIAANLNADLSIVNSCERPRAPALTIATERRGCLLEVLPKLSDPTAIALAASKAHSLLLATPDDAPLQAAAVAAIERGRTYLLDSRRASVFRHFDEVASAREESHLARLLGLPGSADPSTNFLTLGKLLNDAELSARLPRVAERQSAFLLQLQTRQPPKHGAAA